jgi:beta-phosphoglucomutase-like phosphatase (HAD superfamily)
LKRLHTEAFLKRVGQVRPLPGARELLSTLSRLSVPWVIATSGVEERARAAVKILDVGPEVQLITRNDVAHGKPFPDL